MSDLYDKLTRHQAYLEGYKSYFNDTQDRTIADLNAAIKSVIGNVRTTTIADIPEREFRKLQKEMVRVIDRTFKSSKNKFVRNLENFTKADGGLIADLLRSELSTRRRPLPPARVWQRVIKSPVPATAQTVDEMLNHYYAAAKNRVMGALRNSRVLEETNAEFLGRMRGNEDSKGVLNTLKKQLNTVGGTLIQHASSVGQNAQQEIFTEFYLWVAVLDERTTDICKGRDGKVYRYGKGPIPPAHYNCRSKIVPFGNEIKKKNIPQSWFSWLKQQPRKILDDLVGKSDADKIEDGTATETEFPQFNSSKPLTLAQFLNKKSSMLAD